MNKEEKILKIFDKIMGTNKFNNMNKAKFPLLIKIFKQFREDMFITTKEYEHLQKEKSQLLNKIENNFNDEQRKIFEKYWEIENKIISIVEEEIFLFGYLIKDELEMEK